MSAEPLTELRHSTSVAFETETGWRGLLILGASGAGKSELALELIGFGARLIADDQTVLHVQDGQIWLSAPPRLRGLIELRGLGILKCPPIDGAPLHVVVDLDQREVERLPYPKEIRILGQAVPLLHHRAGRAFAVGLKHYLLGQGVRA